VLGNCGLTNQAAGARDAAMKCWVVGFGCVEFMASEEKANKY
jgi:hypothetical protein